MNTPADSASGTTPAGPEQQAGSPDIGEPEFLVVGKLRRPHGLRGEIQMDILTDFPERLKPGLTVFLGPEHTPHRISNLRRHDPAMLVMFAGYETPESIGEFRNQYVQVRVDDRPKLPEGEYYHHELIGLQVVSDAGQYLGVLEYILETGANDVYVVKTELGSEILLPAIAEVVLSINLQSGRMQVHVLPGLIP